MTPFHLPAVVGVDDGSLHPDHADALRALVSSAWHGAWQLAAGSPWIAIGLLVPAVALLVRCTRVSLPRD